MSTETTTDDATPNGKKPRGRKGDQLPALELVTDLTAIVRTAAAQASALAVELGKKSPLEGELRKQTTIPGTEVTSGDPAIDAAALKARLLSVASSKAQSEAHGAREHLRMLMGEAEPPCLRVVGVDDENKRFEFVEEPGKSKLKMREIEAG